MKPYISRKNKKSRLKYGLKNSGIVFNSARCQNSIFTVVTEEYWFEAVLRNNIRLSAPKAALNLELEVS